MDPGAGPSGSGDNSSQSKSKVTRSTVRQGEHSKAQSLSQRLNSDFEVKNEGPVSTSSSGRDNNDQIKQELFYLIIKFLETGPCSDIATQLKSLCETNELLPPRKDWTGRSHVRTFEEFDRFHPHVAANHLVEVCSAICPLLERAHPSSSATIAAMSAVASSSLLGAAVQSLLRSPADHASIHLTLSQSFPVHKRGFRMPINCVRSKRNVPNCVIQSAFDPRHRHQLESAIYRRLKLRKRIVGHGNAVYCVVFDRTSRFVITGADDSLIKVWCCRTLRLLATLRGHRNEICDLAVSHDNRLLASGACDKRVMIWRLDNCAPVAVLSLHSSAIISVAFSPSVRGSKRWLASTAKDGCVCFWPYDPVSLEFEERPVKFIERSRPGCCMMCSCFSTGGGFFVGGCSDHAIRVYSFQPGVPEKIGELEGHRGSVDSVAYSHYDDRFASCSTDGTCRVWSYSRQLWRSLVLCPPGSAAQQQQQQQQARGVSWTADDRCIVTTHSNHLVHCWDSRRGHLLAVFRDHRDDVFVVDCHPVNPRLFLTAGYDGKIAIRDLESSSSAFRHINQAANTRQPVSLFEAKFSPDGDTVAVVDALGHLLMFSLASDDAIDADALDEQFFHTDFSAPPTLDANGWPLDEATQRPPHLMPPPYLVDALMQPYQADIQRRVPGRESLPLSDLIPYCRTDDAGDMRVVDDSIAESVAARDRVFGQPRSYLQTSVWRSRQLVPPLAGALLAQSVARRQAAGDREVRQFCIECRLKPLATGQASMSRSSRQQQQQLQLQNPGSQQQQQQQQQQQHGLQTGNASAAAASAAAAASSSSSQSAAGVSNFSLAGDLHHQSSHLRESQLQLSQQQSLSQALPVESTIAAAVEPAATTNRLTARALYDTDVETGGSGEDVDRVYAQLEAAGDDSSDGRTTESEYSDWLADEGAGRMAMPKRVQRRKVRRSAAAVAAAAAAVAAVAGTSGAGRSFDSSSSSSSSDSRSDDDDDDDEESETTATSSTSSSNSSDEDGGGSDSSEDDEENGDAESPEAAGKRSASRRRGRPSTAAAKQRRRRNRSSSSGPTATRRQKLRQRRQPTTSKAPSRALSRRISAKASDAARLAGAANAAESPTSKQQQQQQQQHQKELKLSEDYRPPEWLTSTLPRHSPYVPQIGDEIVYFRQGHQQYIDNVQATNAYKVDRELPWLRMPDLSPHEQMKVSGMKPLLTKSPRLVHMTLAFADCSRGKFQLRFHDMDNVLDFMVLRQTYDRALERNWQIGDRFRAIIDDYWWSGTIVGIAAHDPAFPDSHWLSIRAKWDNDGTEENLSLWDLHPIIVGEDGSEATAENRPVAAAEFASLQYSPCEREWPNSGGRPAECARIAAALDCLIELPVFREFAQPVDLELYPSYGFMIAYPIDLSTIRSRLRNMYYRRLLSVQYDIRFLANNAEYFNEAETVIVRRARLLTDLLLEFIRRADCADVGRLYRDMLDELDSEHRDGLHLSEFEDEDDLDAAAEAATPDSDDLSGSDRGEPDDKDQATTKTKKRRRIDSDADASASQQSAAELEPPPSEVDPASASSSQPMAAASGPQQPLWTRLCYRVLSELVQRDESLPFQYPVDLEAYPDYLDVVSDPIDLSTAKQRLSNGCYASPLDFFRDLQRMFSNSRAYNTVPTSRIYQMTLSLQREFDRLMNAALRRWRRLRAKGQDASLVGAGAGGARKSSVAKLRQKSASSASKRPRKQAAASSGEVVAMATAAVASTVAKRPPPPQQLQPARRTASTAPNRGRSAAASDANNGGLRKRNAQVNYCESGNSSSSSCSSCSSEGADDTESNDGAESHSEGSNCANSHERSSSGDLNRNHQRQRHQQHHPGSRHPRTRRQVQRQQRRQQRRLGVESVATSSRSGTSAAAAALATSSASASTRPKRRRPVMLADTSDENDAGEAASAEEGFVDRQSKRLRRSKPSAAAAAAAASGAGGSRRSLRQNRPNYRAMLECSDEDEDDDEEAARPAADRKTSDDEASSVDSTGRPLTLRNKRAKVARSGR